VEDSIEELEEEKDNFEIELTVKVKKNKEFSLPQFSLQNTQF